jgi:glucosylceramidase
MFKFLLFSSLSVWTAAAVVAASAPLLLDVGVVGDPVATATDFATAGVPSLTGAESVGNLALASADESGVSFVFTGGQTLTLSERAQGAWTIDKQNNELLADYLYLENGTGRGGPVRVSAGQLGLEAGSDYVLYLFGDNGSADQLGAFTPVNNGGITFRSLAASEGKLVVAFSTSAAYAGEALEFIWARAAGSPRYAAFNGLAIIPALAGRASALRWKSSTAGQPWADRPDVPLGETIPVADALAQRIVVNSTRLRQPIEGWGACFNERGWKAMEVLAPAVRDALMREFFHPTEGLRLGLCRTPIGASDYAIDLYSLNETAGDYTMAGFSIARDRQRLIPFIKAAQALRPDLRLWGSPWSPPSWMKHNNQLSGRDGSDNRIKDDARTFDALALYFARYVEAYAAEGVPVSMVMPQNEPNIDSNYTSCLWTGKQLARFIGYHLGPAFAARGLSTEIYLGTLNDDDKRGGYAYWVEPSLNDAQVRSYLDGVGGQWAAAPVIAETHLLHPEVKLMQTEAECGNHENNWKFAEYQWSLALKWFGAGVSSHIVWNLVLDETGLSTGGWAQCSPVVVHSATAQVTYTPYFYLYKHFSHFIEPGAHLTASYSSWSDQIAFTNPDGGVVIVVVNRSDQNVPLTLNIDGRRSAPVVIPARSFNTFMLSAPTAPAQALSSSDARTTSA